MSVINPGLQPQRPPMIYDTSTANFEREVIERSLMVPVLVDFWATWCEPCKQLTPVLEKLVADYNGAFILAKVDVDQEKQLAAAVGIRSVPTIMLVKDAQLVDGFPGALPEAQLREFLKKHGIVPFPKPVVEGEEPIETPLEAVVRLRSEIAATPDNDELKLDLALALARTGEADESIRLLDGLPAKFALDERAKKARAQLAFAALAATAPDIDALQTRIAADPNDLQARHLLGVHRILGEQAQEGLDQFIEMLARDRNYQDGLPRKALIDAFLITRDAALVSRYRRKMASMLF